MNDEGVPERLRLVSHFPGRLRVRADAFRRAPEVAREVTLRLQDEPAVTSAETSRLTGSLLVVYDPRALQLPRLIHIIVRTGGFDGLEVDRTSDWKHRPRQGMRVRGAVDRMNDRLREVTGGRLDGRVALPGVLAASGVAMFAAGARGFPQWYELIYWAYNIFHNMNPRDTDRPVEHAPADGSVDSA
jgi:hypothetical protein